MVIRRSYSSSHNVLLIKRRNVPFGIMRICSGVFSLAVRCWLPICLYTATSCRDISALRRFHLDCVGVLAIRVCALAPNVYGQVSTRTSSGVASPLFRYLTIQVQEERPHCLLKVAILKFLLLLQSVWRKNLPKKTQEL